jgi:hypothetical protein
LDHGFRRLYCRLNVIYRGFLRTAVDCLFPLRRPAAHLLSARALGRAKALLLQEEWRRACLGQAVARQPRLT